MRCVSRKFIVVITSATLLISMLIPMSARGQQPDTKAFEVLVSRLREGLSLKEEQVANLKNMIATRMPKINELRRRVQSQPYSPQLSGDIEREQQSFRDELTSMLDEDQKSKLSGLDIRLPIPQPPQFIVINLPSRSRVEIMNPLAETERIFSAPAPRAARLTEDQKILHLINRITYGPRPGDIERVRQQGINKFLEEQLHPENIDDKELETRLAVLPTLRLTTAERYQFYPPQNVFEERAKQNNAPPVYGRPQQIQVELTQQKLVRAVSGNRQLQEVMTDFWFNHFNVFAFKGAVQFMLTDYERDAIRPNALGRFRDLLLATAESPAMLFYLDNWLSSAPDARAPRPMPAQTQAPKPAAGASSTPQPPSTTPPRPPVPKRDINENYARELLELHTLGVDGGYTQKDVQEVARCFTGWTIDRPFQGGGFTFRPWWHDEGNKTVLGVTISAGGIGDGRKVIDILSRHPSTARFITKKLCQRFVSDNPSPQMVERIAKVFLNTDGDIAEVLRAILTSPEFFSASSFRSKVKSPLELAASAIRAIDGDTNGAPALHEWLRRMGEPLYQQQAPTGYSETSSSWMNTGVFLNRINFLIAIANNQVNGTRYDVARLISQNASGDSDNLVNKLTALVIHTELSTESRRAVISGIGEQSTASTERVVRTASQERPAITPANLNSGKQVAQVLGLLFSTAEFQRR